MKIPCKYKKIRERYIFFESYFLLIYCRLRIEGIGLSKRFQAHFLCMSGSVLDVAVKFEKIENLELSEQACNFLKTLFGGTIPRSL